jgi:hypothetical protein
MQPFWKDIEGYEGLYQVSQAGFIKSVPRNMVLTRKRRGNYLSIALHKDGVKRNHLIHRLVATAFLDNPKGYPEVNHKDEDKYNNELSNLEWCSKSYNQRYSKGIERTLISPAGIEISFPSTREFFYVYGLNRGSLSRLFHGKQSHVNGWRLP